MVGKKPDVWSINRNPRKASLESSSFNCSKILSYSTPRHRSTQEFLFSTWTRGKTIRQPGMLGCPRRFFFLKVSKRDKKNLLRYHLMQGWLEYPIVAMYDMLLISVWNVSFVTTSFVQSLHLLVTWLKIEAFNLRPKDPQNYNHCRINEWFWWDEYLEKSHWGFTASF